MTRQREIVLTLFENWDQVEKFTQISADSYGTAEEKMTAFTDTIEAAQNRLTVAMERWVLTLQGSSAIKWFYDSLTFLAEQADKLIAIFGGLAVIANWNKIWNNLGITFARVEAQAAKFGTMLDRITAQMGAERGFSGQVKSDAQAEFEAAYISSQQKTYGDRLNKLAGTVGDKDVLAQLGALQNMFINSKDTKKGLEFFKTLEDTGFQFTQELDTATNSIKDMTRQQQMAEYAQYYLTGAQKDSTGQILKQIQQGKISELTQQQLDEANAALAKARSQEYQQVNARMKANVQDWNQKGGVTSAGSAAATGIMSLGASFGGSKTGAMIGSLFGESGEIIGMALGMTIAPALVQGLAKSLISGAASGTLGKIGTAIGTAIGTPIGGVIVAVLLGSIPFIADSILSKGEKLLEEAAEKFKSESDKYSEMLNASAQTSEYDELVKGVDALGRNVSLTNEEYQQFLDTSNGLAAVFPELIQYTDDQGNKFVGLNGKITGVTDAVNELVEAQQRATDNALLDPDLWAENYKTARDTYLDAKSSVESQEGMVEALNDLVGTGTYSEGVEGLLPSQISYKSSDIRSYMAQKYIDAFKEAGYKASATNEGFIITGIDPEEEARVFAEVTARIEEEADNLKNVLKEAQTSISSEVDAIFREMSYNPKYASMFEDMESEVELLLRNIAGNVEFEEDMSEEDYREEIEQTVASVGDTLKKNPAIIQLWMEANEASTVSAVADVKEKLIDALEAAFPNMDWTSAEGGQILLSLGLEFDPNAGNGGAIVDAESTFRKLQSYMTSISSELHGSVTARWFNNLSMEAANQVFEYYRSGMATAITTQNQLEQMLVNDLANNVDMMLAQYQNMVAALPDFTDRLNSYLSSALAGGVIDKQAIQQTFSDLPDYVQNNIENMANELEASIQKLPDTLQDDAREAMDKIASGMSVDKSALIPWVQQFVDEYEETLQEGFKDFDADTLDVQKSIIENLNAEAWGDLEIDGIVDTWSEMKTVLDDITDSYNKLAAAEKEYATYGRISYQTALDLLMTESSLASAMELTTNGVKLKDNAQQILAKAQLQLALSNLEVARTEIQEKIATAQAELQQLSTSNTVEKTVNIADDATTARINQLNLLNEAYALNTQYAMANAKAAYASAVGGDPALAGDAIAEAGEQVTASTKAPTVQKAEVGSYKVTTTYTEAERQARIRELEGLVGHWDTEKGEWTSTGSLQDSDEFISGMVNELRDTIEKGGDMTDFVNWYPTPDSSSSSGSGSAEEAIMNTKDYLDQLKDLHDLIDKEWEAMVAFDEKTFTWTDTAYFDKMEDNLNKQLKELDRLKVFSDQLFQDMGYDDTDHYFSLLERLGEAGQYEELYKLKQSTEEALDKYGLSISDIYDIEKDRIEVQKELNNLDDEQVEDEISLLETRNASVYALLKAQEELIQTSDTEEELIERQADYNDLLEEEVDLRRQIAQFEQDTAERASKYVSGQAYSNSMAYDTLINIQKQALQQQADLALEDYNREFNEAYAQYVSEGMDKSLAYQMAQRSEGAREALETYFDALEAQGDLVVESFEAKMNELETQLEELEMTKPEEWGHIEDINPYYDSMISNIKAQIVQVEEALQNTEMMTDEQIEEWVGKYNDLVQQLQETQKDALEDTTNYQDEQFNALVDWIEEYKQSIEDLKKDVEDYYEPLIDAAQKYADDVAEANDLLELQQNLLNAQKKKQRVYREGIGWVYESPRQKVKDAQDDLDDALNQQYIDDLQDTMDKENELLDKKIEQLDLYLQALQYKHDEADRIERDRLLAQMMNLSEDMSLAEQQKAIHDTIISDWQYFNSYSEGEYRVYIGTFQNFLEEYRDNILQLNELRRQQLEIMSSASMMGTNNGMASVIQGISSSGGVSSAVGMSQSDQNKLNWAGVQWNIANEQGDEEGKQYWHQVAEDIRGQYGYSGGADGSGFYLLDPEGFTMLSQQQGQAEDYRVNDLLYYTNTVKGVYDTQNRYQTNFNQNQQAGFEYQQGSYEFLNGINEQNISDWLYFNDASNQQYNYQIDSITSFANEYEAQVARVQAAMAQLAEAMGSSGGGGDGGGYIGSGGGVKFGSRDNGYFSKAELDRLIATGAPSSVIQAAKEDVAKQNSTYERPKNQIQTTASHMKRDPSKAGTTAVVGNHTVTYDNDGYAVKATNNKWTGKSYSTGIENGPVTYTGLATLHGSPSEPEYVLNSDQAYNLLYNLSTARMAPYESKLNGDNGTIWNLYGDINLENVDDPADFWNSVMQSAGNSWNVSKNNRGR